MNRSLDSEYSGWGLKFGTVFELGHLIRIGGTYGIPVKYKVEETYFSDDALTFDNGDLDTFDEPLSKFRYDVTVPWHADLGASFSLGFLTLSGSARYRDWSETEFRIPTDNKDDPEFEELAAENERIKEEYTETWEYRGGGELYLGFLKTVLRGGFSVLPSPLRSATSEQNKKFLTGGISFLIDRFVSLDVTYMRGRWEQESVDEFTPGGTFEEIITNKIVVGFSYRF